MRLEEDNEHRAPEFACDSSDALAARKFQKTLFRRALAMRTPLVRATKTEDDACEYSRAEIALNT